MNFILQSLPALTSHFSDGDVDSNDRPNREKSSWGLRYGPKRKIKQDLQQLVAKKQRTVRMPPTDSSNIRLPDRFIADRAGLNEEFCFFELGKSFEKDKNPTAEQTTLIDRFNNLKTKKKRLIDCRYSSGINVNQVNHRSELILGKEPPHRNHRNLQTSPIKVVHTEDLVTDFYLSLLHWSQRNILAVALSDRVHLICGKDFSDEAFQPVNPYSDYVTAVQWSNDARLLAIGTASDSVQIWDPQTKQIIREMRSCINRTSTISWHSNHVFSSAGNNSFITSHDVRIGRAVVSQFATDSAKICALTWSPEGTVLASAGSNNTVSLWDINFHRCSPRFQFVHSDTVKAISWCPWKRNLLATGGGRHDRSIKLWDTFNEILLDSVDTGSQVSAIQWSDHSKELVSSHGFPADQLTVWKYNDNRLSKVSIVRYSPKHQIFTICFIVAGRIQRTHG
jgi:WD40 repeat protein